MTKKEIVKIISDKLKESQVLTKRIVQMTFDLIVETLVKNGRIELRNFGVFEVKLRKPRLARNPKTNQQVEVAAKKVVTFQPGKVMEEEVRHAQKVVEPKRKARKPSKATATAQPAAAPVLAKETVATSPTSPSQPTPPKDTQAAPPTSEVPLKPR